MAQISKGIAEALITTETGLMVALPGLFLQFNMTRRLQHYEAFLAHLESVSMQEYWRREPEAAVAV
jgi:biopolymer transport protein ExbB